MSQWASRTKLEHAKRARDLKAALGWNTEALALFMYCNITVVRGLLKYETGHLFPLRTVDNIVRMSRLRWLERELKKGSVSRGADPRLLRKKLPRKYRTMREIDEQLNIPGMGTPNAPTVPADQPAPRTAAGLEEPEATHPPEQLPPPEEPKVEEPPAAAHAPAEPAEPKVEEVEAEVVGDKPHKFKNFELAEHEPLLKSAVYLESIEMLYAETKDGHIAVAVTPLCDELGIDARTQMRKLDDPGWAAREDMTVRIPSDPTRVRRLWMIHSRSLWSWLRGINPRKVHPSASAVLEKLQQECEQWIDLLLRRGAAYNQSFADPMGAMAFFASEVRTVLQQEREKDRLEMREQNALMRQFIAQQSPGQVIPFPKDTVGIPGKYGWRMDAQTGERWVPVRDMAEKIADDPFMLAWMHSTSTSIDRVVMKLNDIAKAAHVPRPVDKRRDIGPPLVCDYAPDTHHTLYYHWDDRPDLYERLRTAACSWATLGFCSFSKMRFQTRNGDMTLLYPNFGEAEKILRNSGYSSRVIRDLIAFARDSVFTLPGPIIEFGTNAAEHFG